MIQMDGVWDCQRNVMKIRDFLCVMAWAGDERPQCDTRRKGNPVSVQAECYMRIKDEKDL